MIPALTRYRAAVVAAGIALVSSSNAGAQTKTVSVPAPAAIVAGNLLYAVFTCNDTKTAVSLASAGWTLHTSLVFSTKNDNGFIGAFYKIATASEPASYTFAGATVTAVNVGIVNLSGVNASSPFGSVAPVTGKATASTSAVFKAITTSGAQNLLVVAGQGGNFSSAVSTSFTPPAGYGSAVSSTSQAAAFNSSDAENCFAALSSATVPAGANTPAPGTFNVSYAYGVITVALTPAS